jgi:uncharacterized protein YhdP
MSVGEINLRTGKFSHTRAAPITFSCTCASEEHQARLSFQGLVGPLPPGASLAMIPWEGDLVVGDVPLPYFRPYLTGWENSGALKGRVYGDVSLDGSVGGDFVVSGTVDIENLWVERPDLFSQRLSVKKVRTEGTVSREGQNVNVPSLTVTVPGIRVSARSTVLLTEPVSVDVVLESEGFDYGDVIPYLPVSLLSKRMRALLTENVRTGKVDSFALRYSGDLDAVLQHSASSGRGDREAAIQFHDVSLTLFEDVPQVENLRGEITYKNKALAMRDVGCTMGDCSLEHCRADVSAEGFLAGSAAVVLDLSDVDQIVHSKGLSERAKHELRNVKRLDGEGHVTIEVSGPVGDVGALEYKGELALANATIDYRDFRKAITNVDARITFDQSDLTIREAKGYWATSPITCHGEITTYRTRQSEIRAHVQSDQARLEDLASAFFPWMEAGTENPVEVGLDLYLKGYRKEGFSYNGRTEFVDLAFSVPFFPRPFSEVQGSVDFSQEGLTFRTVQGKTGSSEMSFAGKWTNYSQPVMTGKIEGSVVNFEDIPDSPGTQEDRTPSYRLDKVVFSVDKGIYKDLFVRNLHCFINYEEGVLALPMVRVDGGDFRGFEFMSVHNMHDNQLRPVTIERGIITAPFLELHSGGGTWAGTDIRLPHKPDKPERFSITSQIKKVPVVNIMQWFPPDRRSLTGSLDLEGSIEGTGKSVGEVMKSLEGSVDFSVQNGILKKATILSKLFSLLNVSRMFTQDYAELLESGLHFDSIDGSLEIQDGVMHSESILLDSPAMKMNAVGDIDVGQQELDMEIAVQPFETVDKVLGKIPILGTVLIGDEGAFVVSYYKLEGPLEDPTLDPVVFQSLGRKGQSIFQGIFNIPDDLLISPSKALWDKITDNGDEEEETGEEKRAAEQEEKEAVSE